MPTNEEQGGASHPVLDLTLYCRWTQRLYFSAHVSIRAPFGASLEEVPPPPSTSYPHEGGDFKLEDGFDEDVSETNNILHYICPSLVARRKDRHKAVVAKRFAEIIQHFDARCDEVDQNLDNLLDFIREKLESEGIDPNPIITRYAGVLNQQVWVNTPVDARFLTLLGKTDRVMSFLTAAFLSHVFGTAEYTRSDRDLRNWMNLLYRARMLCHTEASALLETFRTHSPLTVTA